jgi:hypothetical protein
MPNHVELTRAMRTLTLPLKGIYFDQIAAGTKPEEFRLVTPFWRRRLEEQDYDLIELTRGYPKRGDTSRRLVLPWKGYRITTICHPHFGPDHVEVFAIDVARPAPVALKIGDWIESDLVTPRRHTRARLIANQDDLVTASSLLADPASGWRRATRDWGVAA